MRRTCWWSVVAGVVLCGTLIGPSPASPSPSTQAGSPHELASANPDPSAIHIGQAEARISPQDDGVINTPSAGGFAQSPQEVDPEAYPPLPPPPIQAPWLTLRPMTTYEGPLYDAIQGSHQTEVDILAATVVQIGDLSQRRLWVLAAHSPGDEWYAQLDESGGAERFEDRLGRQTERCIDRLPDSDGLDSAFLQCLGEVYPDPSYTHCRDVAGFPYVVQMSQWEPSEDGTFRHLDDIDILDSVCLIDNAWLELGDFDGDGAPEAAVNIDWMGRSSVDDQFENTRSTTILDLSSRRQQVALTTQVSSETGWSVYGHLTWRDLNGDHHDDIVLDRMVFPALYCSWSLIVPETDGYLEVGSLAGTCLPLGNQFLCFEDSGWEPSMPPGTECTIHLEHIVYTYQPGADEWRP